MLMKEIIQKILSLLMAFVVLLSTMSFTIGKHYCGDTLVSTAVFKEAKTCGMEMESPSTEGCSITKKNCCTNEQIIVEGQDELSISFDSLSLDQQLFIASFIYSYSALFIDSEEEATSYSIYRPPILVKTIHKLDEVYLI